MRNAPVRVLLDGRVDGADGIGRYTRSIVSALTGLGPEIDIQVLGPTGTCRYSRAEGVELMTYARHCRADLIHVLDYRIPTVPIVGIPMVVTVHDVLRLIQPNFCYSDQDFEVRFGAEGLSDLKAITGDLRDLTRFPGQRTPASTHEEFLGRMLTLAVDQAHAVIAPTAAVAHPLCGMIPAAQPKVWVSPWGSTTSRQPPTCPSWPCLSLTCSTSAKPRAHKGIPVLLEAVARSTAYRDGVHLVLAGRDFTPHGSAVGLARQILDERRVHPMGEVSDSVLAALYTHATALLHLAAHEGFGFPPRHWPPA